MLSESEDVDDVQEEEEMEKQEDEDITDVQNNATSSIKRKKSSSPVWEVATQIEGGSKCKFCGKTFLSKDSSTSNIIKHMQSVHSEKEEVKKMNKSLKEREGVKK